MKWTAWVLQMMEKHGANLSQPRLVRHWIYVNSQNRAEQGAAELRKAGYAASAGPVEGRADQWRVLSETTAVLTPELVSLMRQTQARVAERLRGEYDGWKADHQPSE